MGSNPLWLGTLDNSSSSPSLYLLMCKMSWLFHFKGICGSKDFSFISMSCPAPSTSQGCPSSTPAPLSGSLVAAMTRCLEFSTPARNLCQLSCLLTLQGPIGTSFGVSIDLVPESQFQNPLLAHDTADVKEGKDKSRSRCLSQSCSAVVLRRP